MKKIDKKAVAKKTLLGGLVIILPVALLAMGIRWLFKLVTDLIQPLTNLVTKIIGMPEIFADILVLAGMTGLCFAVGWLVTTASGAWFHSKFDGRLAQFAPGYTMMKDIVGQFFGDASKSPFANGEVALVRLFGNETEVTVIVTSKHEDGRYTVFMPTGPNPTSGNIYHVTAEQVTLCPDIAVSDAMRTIIACGAGTGDLLTKPSSIKVKESNTPNVVDILVMDDCTEFLKAHNLYDIQSLVESKHIDVAKLDGFQSSFVGEITHALFLYESNNGITDFVRSDWAMIRHLELGKTLTEELNEAGYYYNFQITKEEDNVLLGFKGLGPKTLERIKKKISGTQ